MRPELPLDPNDLPLSLRIASGWYGVSINRYATRRDANEQTIMDAIEKAGWHCWQLDYPVDLLCWKEGRGFVLMEVKTGKGKIRKEQEAQRNFVETTRTPVVRTPEDALRALGAIGAVPA